MRKESSKKQRKKWRMRVCSAILAASCVFSMMPAQAAELHDTTAPLLDLSTLTVDKKIVQAGESVTIQVKATDDLSGVDDGGFTIWQLCGSVSMEYNAQTGYLEGTVKTSAEDRNGTYELDWLDVYDKSGNRGFYSTYIYDDTSDLSAASFTIEGGRPYDWDDPVIDLSTLRVDKTTVFGGEQVKISVNITDESTIEDASVTYKQPLHDKWKEVELSYNSDSGLYEGYLYIADDADYGEWIVTRIDARDTGSGDASYGEYDSDVQVPGTEAATFLVKETDPDLNAPTIDVSSLKVSGKNAKPGDKIKVSFQGSDDKQPGDMLSADICYGASKANLSVENSSENWMTFSYNPQTGCYEGVIEISQRQISGDWKIHYLSLSDGTNETRIYNSKSYLSPEEPNADVADLSVGDITVSGTGNDADTEAPVLTDQPWKIWTWQATAGDSFVKNMRIFVKDNLASEVYGTVVFESPSGKLVACEGEIGGYFGENDQMISLIDVHQRITPEDEHGKWRISHIALSDQLNGWGRGNERIYYNPESVHADEYAARGYQPADLSAGDFLVYRDADGIDKEETNKIFTSIEAAGSGTEIAVDMKEATVLSQQVLAKAYEKEQILVCSGIGGTVWTIDTTKLSSENLADTDISVTRAGKDNGSISSEMINAIAGTYSAEQLNFVGGGSSMAAALTLTVDKTFENMKCVAVGITGNTAQTQELLGVSLIKDQAIKLPLSKTKDCVLVYAVNGDTSADGQVNITDLMQTLHHVSGRSELGVLEQGIADVDTDGTTNITDLMKTLHAVSGRTESL